MLGNIMGVAFGPSTGISPSLGWRLMLGSTVVLPLIVCAQVYFCPESPRYEAPFLFFFFFFCYRVAVKNADALL